LTQSDPWVRKLLIGSLVAVAASVVLFIAFKLLLIYGASTISSVAAR